jgi:hypothetical protein
MIDMCSSGRGESDARGEMSAGPATFMIEADAGRVMIFKSPGAPGPAGYRECAGRVGDHKGPSRGDGPDGTVHNGIVRRYPGHGARKVAA